MSGIKRVILSEVTHKAGRAIDAIKAFTPENMRKEKGRSTLNDGIVKNADMGVYLGKNGKDAALGTLKRG